jgi:hypothetical protein
MDNFARSLLKAKGMPNIFFHLLKLYNVRGERTVSEAVISDLWRAGTRVGSLEYSGIAKTCIPASIDVMEMA